MLAEDPASDIQAVERALRRLIREVLKEAWISAKGAPRVEELRSRATEEEARRDGALIRKDLLEYTELYSLTSIIERQWELFKPALSDLARTKVFFGILEDFRNAVAHSRTLLDFERHLLCGASGQLRNQVALYLSRNDGPARHYPTIESIANNFGVIEEKYFSADGWISEPRLEVGDSIVFECAAVDPRGRDLSWTLEWGPSHSVKELVDEARGNVVQLRWAVLEKHVGEKGWLRFTVLHSGQYHRRSGYDDVRELTYSVNPPPET